LLLAVGRPVLGLLCFCFGDPPGDRRGAGSFIEGGAVLGELPVAFGDLGRRLGLARAAVLIARLGGHQGMPHN
jgi:hypothetical protein